MDITYYIEADFDCAFLINGVFREKGGLLGYPAKSPLYVTALPLNAALLPYTAKIVSGAVIGNENLVGCYSAADTKIIVKLKERHNYVYSPVASVTSAKPVGAAYDLFRAVKKGDLGGARALITQSLGGTIDNDGLIAFFAPYTEILPNRFAEIGANYLLARTDKKCEAFNFAFSGNLIDNIEQIELLF